MAVRRSTAPTDLRSIPSAAAGPIIPGAERMDPPSELRPVEQKIWRRITGRLPAEWFTADNEPMLKELCRHVAFSDELALEMEAVRARRMEIAASSEPLKERTAQLSDATEELHGLMRLHCIQSERIGNLATKLRLTNQSRWQAAKADEQRMRATAGPRPWEAWSQ